MKKSRFLLVSIIVLFALLAVSIALFFLGTGIISRANNSSSQQRQWYIDQFQNICDGVKRDGVNDQLGKKIQDFFDRYDTRMNKNVLIFDGDGNVLCYNNKSLLNKVFSDNMRVKAVWGSNQILFLKDDGILSGFSLENNPYGADGSQDASLEKGSVGNADQVVFPMPVTEFLDMPDNDFRGEIHVSDYYHGVALLCDVSGNDGGKKFALLLQDISFMQASNDQMQRAYGIGMPMQVSLLVCVPLFWLLLPVWTFLDARRRQTQPLPWALLVLLTNVIGLVVYWIVLSQNSKVAPLPTCPSCGKTVKKGHLYCPWCAAPLVKACKGCGKALEKDWVACPWCGKPSGDQ